MPPEKNEKVEEEFEDEEKIRRYIA